MSIFYDVQKYKNAIEEFDEFAAKCEFEPVESVSFGDFSISTITCIAKLAEIVSIEQLFYRLNNDDKIAYLRYSNNARGIEPKKSMKELSPKNQLFANQMSIGFNCSAPHHKHKNPISVKVFRNGCVQMTGCKDNNEIHHVYKHLVKRFLQFPDIVNGVKEFNDSNVNVEMINGTFYVNHHLDLKKVLRVFTSKYRHDQVFVIQNKRSPLNFSIKMFGYFDKVKKKDKIPSVFIYNTGAINIIATKQTILDKTYNFMVDMLKTHWEDVVHREMIFPSLP